MNKKQKAMMIGLKTLQPPRLVRLGATTTPNSLGATAVRQSQDTQQQIRSFSTAPSCVECDPTQKLRTAFELYRQRHFSRETLVRFRKEMVKAFPDASTTPSSSNRMFPADNLNDVLTKIGMNDNLLLSKNEIDVLLAETGTPENRMIPVSKLIQLV